MESSPSCPQNNQFMIPLLELISALTLSMPDESSLIALTKSCLQSLDSSSPFREGVENRADSVQVNICSEEAGCILYYSLLDLAAYRYEGGRERKKTDLNYCCHSWKFVKFEFCIAP